MTATYPSHPHYVAASFTANWAVTDWYIDGVSGSDTNNGITSGTPLKTGAELALRLGPYAKWGQSVTIHVLANGMIDALVLRGSMLNAGTFLDIIGTPTVLATDTLGTFAAVNHATPVAAQLTGTTIIDWTSYVWRRIRITSGTRAGAVCWIAKVNPGGVGVATARVSPPVRIDTASNTTVIAQAPLVAGDPFVVESLPSIPSMMIEVDGPINTALTTQYSKRQVTFQAIDCLNVRLAVQGNSYRAKTWNFGCRIAVVDTTGAPCTGTSGFHANLGFLLAAIDNNTSTTTSVYGNYVNGVVGDGIVNCTMISDSFWQNVLFQAARCQAITNNVQVVAFDIQVFDVPAGSAVNWFNGDVTNLSGSGNSGTGINCNTNVKWRLAGTINISGVTAAAQLTGPPAINMTLAQFLQPDDYAQKGTATLVAGTVTVTVPWWDPTTQKLTVSHAVPSGIIGSLTTPTAGQTSTQFTIDSEVATDVSTVNWAISPLGRNIFITTL